MRLRLLSTLQLQAAATAAAPTTTTETAITTTELATYFHLAMSLLVVGSIQVPTPSRFRRRRLRCHLSCCCGWNWRRFVIKRVLRSFTKQPSHILSPLQPWPRLLIFSTLFRRWFDTAPSPASVSLLTFVAQVFCYDFVALARSRAGGATTMRGTTTLLDALPFHPIVTSVIIYIIYFWQSADWYFERSDHANWSHKRRSKGASRIWSSFWCRKLFCLIVGNRFGILAFAFRFGRAWTGLLPQSQSPSPSQSIAQRSVLWSGPWRQRQLRNLFLF